MPERFTEVGVLVPEVEILRKGLDLVAAIAEDEWTDAAATAERMRAAAHDAVEKARH